MIPMNRLLKVTMLMLCLLWLFQIHTNSSWPEETANAHSSIIKPFSSQKVLCLKYSPFLEKIFCLKISHPCDGEDILSCKATTFLVMDMHGETLLEKQGLLTVPDAILTDNYRWPNNSAKVYFFKYTYLEKPELERPEDEYIALYSFDTENGKMERVSPEGLYVLDYDLNPENGSLLLQGYYIENIHWGGGSAARKNSQLYLISLRQAGVVLKLDLPEKIAVSHAAVGTDDSILYFSHQKGVTDLVKMSISHPDLKETLWKTQEPILYQLYQSVEWSSSKEKFLYLYCDSCSTEILDNWMEALAFASLQGVSSTI